MQQRAWSTLEIKAVDPERRIIEGIASTPTPDRGGDIMVPAGAQFSLPMPFLWQHEDPIGEVCWADVRPEGIWIKASVSRVTVPGRFATLVEQAWAAFTAAPPLVRGLSIGWSELESEDVRGTAFKRFTRWIWGELSAVTIPMNTEATILAVKAADVAASGPHTPSVGGSLPVISATKGARPMTVPEQITSYESQRHAKAARMTAIMTTAADAGVTLEAAQTEEYETLSREAKSLDAHLVRLRDHERMTVSVATPIVSAPTPAAASELRGGTLPVIQVKSNLPKGTAFTRMCMAMASSKGDSYKAMERARSWSDSPEVELMVKAAVAAGTTTDATWAGPLAVAQPLVNEFLELLRPRTLLGRIPGLKQVPFNITVSSQTTGGTYGWVGQNKPKPVTKADYATVSLGFAKAAGIIVLTEELVKLSTPSAESLVRQEMIDGMSQFLDTQFVDPAVAAVAGVNPASVTNGASTAAASGVTGAAAKADLSASVAVFTAANIPLSGSVWLMSDSNAFGLGLSMNALGQPLFPGVSIEGGSIFGIPIVISNNVGNRVVLLHAPSVLYADDGGVNIDVSREASIQMDSTPTDPTDATTVLVSLWQRNLVGLKAERYITWKLARTAASRYITAAAYNGS